MNDSLNAARKFKQTSLIIFSIFFLLTFVLVSMFAYLFNNYWLLFGIVFAIYISKLTKLLLLFTVGVVIHWYTAGFHFSDETTFFWFSTIFGFIFQAFVQGFDELSTKVIDNEASEMTSSIIDQIQRRNKRRDIDK
jgi:hypothetical protein